MVMLLPSCLAHQFTIVRRTQSSTTSTAGRDNQAKVTTIGGEAAHQHQVTSSAMGNVDTKLHFRKAVVQLTSKTEPIDADDDSFWEQFWSEHVNSVQDIFALVPAQEIRGLREEAPSNLATLCYKAVEKLVRAVDNSCRTQREQQTVLNCVRLLTRLLPYIFEDPEWKGFFWSSLPAHGSESDGNAASNAEDESVPLAHSLLNAVCDLLFCPDFTVINSRKSGPDKAEDLAAIDSCEYIWEAGVGFAHSPPRHPLLDSHRTELLLLLLTCFSETMYHPPVDIALSPNRWIAHLTSAENRHALPMFTSLLNTVCAYDPVGLGVPYNHLIFNDSLEPLVEAALQILIVTLDHDMHLGGAWVDNAAGSADDSSSVGHGSRVTPTEHSTERSGQRRAGTNPDEDVMDNLFINYLSRIHRDEDFQFILQGITRLLNNPLMQTYLPNSTKKVHFHQELLVFFWKLCDYNKKFLYYVLKSSDVLEVLVPILYHLNDSRADQSRVGLMHIGVFILLLLSGERNFGVRLNKPYTATIPMDIPVFTGTHADLLIVVFHKIITTGHQRLQPLFDCLLTILVNVSPYLKTLSMVASTKLLHLLEAFSTPWFLFSSPANHHLVFFLLEIFNNIIQYQFDGNSNLVYTIIRKRQVFHGLANLPCDSGAIARTLNRRAERAKVVAQKAPAQRVPIQTRGSVSQAATDGGGGGDEAHIPSGGVEDRRHVLQQQQPATLDGAGESLGGGVWAAAASLDESESTEDCWEGSRPALPATPGTLKATLPETPAIAQMTERENAHPTLLTPDGGVSAATGYVDPSQLVNGITAVSINAPQQQEEQQCVRSKVCVVNTKNSLRVVPIEDGGSISTASVGAASAGGNSVCGGAGGGAATQQWTPSAEWVHSWKTKLPLQTIMRLLQVLVPQVEKICIDKGLTDESEILKFLQHGTLVGLLPVPHPILIRKYQANGGTTTWFRTYMWGVIYLRNVDPPVWYDTDVKLFEIQRV